MNLVEFEGIQDIWNEMPETNAIEQNNKYIEDHWEEITQKWDDAERTDDCFYKEPSYICWQGCWMGDSLHTLAY